ncbi:hypothetical protein ACLMJK_009449 [Lecanora helva]
MANIGGVELEERGQSPKQRSVDRNEGEEEIDKFKPGWKLLAAFASIAVVNLATTLDASIISVALPVITVDLKGSAIQASWSGTSFLLTSTVCQPNFVALSHLWGRRSLLLTALTFFTVGSIVCAISRNFVQMLAGRSVQGVGAGGVIVMTEILITDMVPLREQGNYYAAISIVWIVGSVAGPFIGGALAQKHAWRWIFYLNLPIVAIGFAGIIAFLRLESRRLPVRQRIRQFDYVGAVIFLASSNSLLLPITWGGVMYTWSSWRTLVPMILGVLGLAMFIFYEAYFHYEGSRFVMPNTQSLLPLNIFLNKDSNIAYFVTFIHGIIVWTLLYYLPLFFEGAKDFTPILAGVAALPLILTIIPFCGIVGVVAARTGRYRGALRCGWVLTTLGTGILYLLSPKTSTPEWVLLMLVSGIGIGLMIPAMALAVQASAPSHDVAVATAMFTFFRSFGQTVGVAIGGVMFQNQMAANAAAYPALSESATQYSLDVVGLIRQINAMLNSDSTKRLLQLVLGQSIRPIWALLSGMAGVALLSTIFMKHYDLNQQLSTEQGFEGQWRPSNKHRCEQAVGKQITNVADPKTILEQWQIMCKVHHS